MEIENRKVNEKLIQDIEILRNAVNEISVYDFNVYTAIELYYTIANKLNEVIQECLRFEIAVSEQVIEQNECLQYLLNEGLAIELARKLLEMKENGELENIIDEILLDNVKHSIDNLKRFEINVCDFGAVGDGIADDTNAFKEAINSIKGQYDGSSEISAHNGGGTLIVPCGTFKITDTIFIPSNITIKGTGKSSFGINKDNSKNSTILWDGDNDKPAVSFLGINKQNGTNEYVYYRTGREIDNRVNIPTYNGELLDLTIYATNNQDVGIVFSGCPTSRIENVKVSGFKVGIITSSCWGAVIDKTFIYTSFIGIANYKSCNLLKIRDCYCHVNGNTENVDSGSKLYTLVYNDCLPIKNQQTGIILSNSRGLSIDNLVIEKFKNGIALGSETESSTSTNIQNVWLEATADQPITIKNGRHSLINVNYIADSTGNKASLVNSTKSVITFINCRGGYNKILEDIDSSNPTKITLFNSQYTTGNYNCIINESNIDKITTTRLNLKDNINKTGWDILGGSGYSCIAPYVDGTVKWSADIKYKDGEGYVFASNIKPSKANTLDIGTNTSSFNNGYFSGVVKTGYKSSANRPTLTSNDQGSMMFDTTVNKLIIWTGSKWVDSMGNNV